MPIVKYRVSNSSPVFLLFLIVFLLSPFLSMLLAFFMQYKSRNFDNRLYIIIVSIFFSLLAYTQNSIGIDSTDIIRYYDYYYPIISGELNFREQLIRLMLFDAQYFLFHLLNVFICVLTKNVQYISFFWVFIIYYFHLCAIRNIFKYKNLDFNRNSKISQFFILLISLFCLVFFTQVTDIIKQAASFSLFFYGVTLILLNSKKNGYFFVVISMCIHSSVFFLIPILLIHKLSLRMLQIMCVLSLLMIKIDTMKLISYLIPNFGILTILKNKALGYSHGVDSFFSSTSLWFLTMTFVMIAMYLGCVCLQNRKNMNSNDIYKLILMYFIILILNFSNSHTFTRFITMSHFIYTLLIIEFFTLKSRSYILHSFFTISFVLFFLCANFYFTYGRCFGSDYASSYMDNSIYKITTSSFFEYINYKI